MKEDKIKLYASIVESLANMSSDSRLKVGALLLKDGRIISTGYNGHLPGEPHTPTMVDGHDVSTIHAELNCLLHCSKAGIQSDNCILFVSHFPCSNCVKYAIMAGVSEIYYVNDYKNSQNKILDKIKIIKVNK
jgi:dCMP deaminase